MAKVRDMDMVYIGIRGNHTSQKEVAKVRDMDIDVQIFFGQYF